MDLTISRGRFEIKLLEFFEEQKEYREECKEYAKKGWRHQFCFHGTNMWVDYDCACASCEDGHPDEYTAPEDVRKFFQEWYNVDYDGDDVLGMFQPIEWGDDQVEVVKVHYYWTQKFQNGPGSYERMDCVECTLALVSDGTEFQLFLETSDLVLTDLAADL